MKLINTKNIKSLACLIDELPYADPEYFEAMSRYMLSYKYLCPLDLRSYLPYCGWLGEQQEGKWIKE